MIYRIRDKATIKHTNDKHVMGLHRYGIDRRLISLLILSKLTDFYFPVLNVFSNDFGENTS